MGVFNLIAQQFWVAETLLYDATRNMGALSKKAGKKNFEAVQLVLGLLLDYLTNGKRNRNFQVSSDKKSSSPCKAVTW
ncbi:hypothetical protein [Ferruginibacter sp. SUN106]|uniref:hypothetical protein n=1 Tax=Ferruginibacter sp. SUN106 TaxID=2978348 RepID=UPI003D362F57